MKAIDQDLRVFELARALGADAGHSPVEAIVGFCRRLVKGWMNQAGGIGSIQELERLVCSRLGLQFQEFRHEGELHTMVRQHVEAGDVVFASLPALFDDETFATLIRCRQRTPGTGPRYVAVIDCRARKASRRWFSRWHEIAHLLTLDAPSEAEPVHRSTSEHSAVERLMDMIAADIGFFEPLFAPVLAAEVLGPGGLDFASIARVRERYAPEASFQATAIACLRRWPKAAVYVEAGLGLTAKESHQFDETPIPARRPSPKLRVLKVVGNDASRNAGLSLVRNMQVPEGCIIHRVFFWREPGFLESHVCTTEDLGDWRRSSGRPLSHCPLVIEARPGRQHVEALIQASCAHG